MGQPEVLQRIDPPAAEVGGEQIGLIDLEPGLQSQLALPSVAVRLEDLVVNGFAQVGERRIGRPALLVSSASSSREIIDCTWGR